MGVFGIIGYYKNYVKGYPQIAIPPFNLTKKDIVFQWNLIYKETFDLLKIALVFASILVKLDFTKPFILDVD